MPADAALTGSAIPEIHRRLLRGESATAVLRALFGDPVTIIRVPSGDPGAPEALRADAAGCRVLHRRVRLVAAARPVSLADLWYVPERLAPGMEEALRDSDTPFGDVVAPLRPGRRTLSARAGTAGETYALVHEAMLFLPSGAAIAAVRECYGWV